MYIRLRSQKYGSSDTTIEAMRAAPVMKLKTHRTVQSSAAFMRPALLDKLLYAEQQAGIWKS